MRGGGCSTCRKAESVDGIRADIIAESRKRAGIKISPFSKGKREKDIYNAKEQKDAEKTNQSLIKARKKDGQARFFYPRKSVRSGGHMPKGNLKAWERAQKYLPPARAGA